ncbi:ABC transporter ATP-binding protein [Paenibacillus protaetiae]|uniref:ABC transporter ATP-binding protein n=1 Tax=Paenibacillus protaetiae TaxID=2509456 RepID=A0A4V0YFQ5_9BACL|nr:ABC transporter ATP-binding protein [Paenibacillus protaetiae]
MQSAAEGAAAPSAPSGLPPQFGGGAAAAPPGAPLQAAASAVAAPQTAASAYASASVSPPNGEADAPHPASGETPAVEAIRLAAYYGDTEALKPVSFTAAAGSITALIGPSGSGKTTLARALYGLLPERRTSGTARLNGKPVYGAAPGEAPVRWHDAAFIFQDPQASFHPLMTIGRQFAEVQPPKLTAAANRAAAAKALSEVQLAEHVLDRYPHELSGGMLSRAMIALALLNHPRVLIADEPTAALDPIVKREVLELLAAKTREHQMALILITHDIKAAYYMADRVLELKDGALVRDTVGTAAASASAARQLTGEEDAV